jgi:hypothetical protein
MKLTKNEDIITMSYSIIYFYFIKHIYNVITIKSKALCKKGEQGRINGWLKMACEEVKEQQEAVKESNSSLSQKFSREPPLA